MKEGRVLKWLTWMSLSCWPLIGEPGSNEIVGLSLKSADGQKLVVNKGHLKLKKKGSLKKVKLRGMASGSKKIPLRIDALLPDPKNPDLMLYQFSTGIPGEKVWKSLCPKDDGSNGNAIVLKGMWDATGKHLPSNSFATISCVTGAVAKCVRWGYRPWEERLGRSLKDFHQACTRMIRADYFGNGKSHTTEGSKIFVVDILGINKGTPSRGMAFEAAWGVDGAVTVARPRKKSQRSLAQFGLNPLQPSFKPPGSNEVLLINYSYER